MTPRPHSIVFLHKAFPFGGAEKVTMDMANYLASQGMKVAVLTIDHREHGYPKDFRRNFHVEILPPKNIKCSPKVARAVCRYIRQHNVDCVISYREILYARWLKQQTGVTFVFNLISMPGYEMADIQERMSKNVFSSLFYRLGGLRLNIWFYRSKYRREYRSADVYGVICEAYRQDIVGMLSLNRQCHKVRLFPLFVPLPKTVCMDKEKIMLFVGRLSYRDKRVDRLLRIWKQVEDALPDWKLKIVGAGPEESRLRDIAAAMDLKRCSFEGASNNVQSYYDMASILCLTSSFEGWPLCVAEAQSNGVIPIVFDSFGGSHDLIRTPMEGILVEAFDEQTFAQELVRLASDERRMIAMREAVVKKSEQYDIRVAGPTWEMLGGEV